MRSLCACALVKRKLPVDNQLGIPRRGATRRGTYACRGEDEKEVVRVLYMAATRARQRLVVGVSGGGRFAARL